MEDKPKTKRLFIGIPINDDIKQVIIDSLPTLKKHYQSCNLKWAPLDNFHLTIKFLGSTATEKIPEIIQTITNILADVTCFEIVIKKFMRFPPHKHRLLAISVSLNEDLAKLYQQIETSTIALGFEPEQRPYLPHITIARTTNKIIPDLPENTEINQIQIVNHITLYQSLQSNEGSTYNVLKEFHLKK